MKTKRQPKKKVMPMRKTSLKLPEGLWKRFRIRALEEDREAQAIVAELIDEWLKKDKGDRDAG